GDKTTGKRYRHPRLLEPVDAIVLEFAAHLDGDVGGPAHVDVDHDGDVRAERFAHAAHIVEIGGKTADMRNLLFDRTVAALFIIERLGDHAVAARIAETARAIGRQC